MLSLLRQIAVKKKVIGGVLLLVVLLAGIVPKGFMPSAAADGSYTLVICTQDGFRTITLDANGIEIPPPEGTPEGLPGFCLFGGCSTFAPFPSVHFTWVPQPAAAPGGPILNDRLSGRRIAGRKAARAPPVLV